MSDKFLDLVNGVHTLKTPPTTSTGSGDAGKIPALDANGKWDESFMPSGIGAENFMAVCSEGLTAGDIVNIWNDLGVTKIRKADAGSNKPGRGFVRQTYLSGSTATVQLDGTNDQLSGLTPGAIYFLSATTPGGVTVTPPTTSGQLVQPVVVALTATTARWITGTPVTIA